LAETKRAPSLEQVKTCELVEELKKREGIEAHTVEPYKNFHISLIGPTIVLVITD